MKSNKSNGALTAQINVGNNTKSGFDLSNNVLGTGKIGRIIPTRALHVMPGDTIKADSKVAVQFEPLAVPILANMDVRQEHFYVPYNVVWKNWDKFISGGEKMDYQGAVPSRSMEGIVSTVSGKLMLNYVLYYWTNLVEGGNMVFALRDIRLDEAHNQLDSVGDIYQVKDLLKPQYKVLDMFREYLDRVQGPRYLFTYIQVNDEAEVDNLVTIIKNVVIGEDIVNTFANTTAIVGSKYFDMYKDFVRNNVRKGVYNIALPIGSSIEFLNLYYEYYKSFIGYGSNIDYLGMGCVSFSEFMYAILARWTGVVNDSDLVEDTTHHDVPYDLGDLPSSNFSDMPLSMLHLRANYNIWYNNYRDILLESSAFEPVDSDYVEDDELFALLIPRQRCWEKDAFTTALDNPGTGNIAVPVEQSMLENRRHLVLTDGVASEQLKDNDMLVTEYTVGDETYRVPTGLLSGQSPIGGGVIETTGFSLHALEAAQRAQKWLQKALYFGNRISDFYYLRFGVRFLDARLRLPELLTSSRELVKLDVIMNNTNITTEANGEVFQSVAGDRAAYASAYDNGNSFDRFCEEHGVIMSFLTIMPQVTYAYGINRDYSRLDQFDFAFNDFATLGMDTVYDTEITSTALSNAFLFGENQSGITRQDVGVVFGYQGRYYDYKAKHSEEHGELLDSQDMYTFSRRFNMFDKDGRPRLNYEFVHCFPDLDMFVVDSPLADYFRYDIRHSTAAERELPSQSIYI